MELGSEFSIDFSEKQVVEHNIFALLSGYNTFYTDYGRTATALLYQYLQRKKGTEQLKVLLPSYSCDTVRKAFPHDAVTYYDLKEEFAIDMESVQKLIETGKFDNGIFYITHYFGWLQETAVLETVRSLCDKHQIVIVEDTTHSILGEISTIGDYCISSLRKWFPIPEGSVIYSRATLPEEWNGLKRAKTSRKIEAMVLKNLFLGGAEEYQELVDSSEINQFYRKIYAGEELKAGLKMEQYRISDLSYFLLQCEDIETISNVRKKNYSLLQKKLSEKGIALYGSKHFGDNQSAVPFTAILQIKDKTNRTRDGLREYLMSHRVYCAVHWPIQDATQCLGRNVKEWTQHCLSLPIDQRYGEEEMEYLADMVISYLL